MFSILSLSTQSVKDRFLLDVVKLLNDYLSFGLATVPYIESLLVSGEIYLAVRDDKLLGAVTLVRELDSMLVKHLVVDIAHRGGRIALRLVDHLLAEIPPSLDVRADGWVKPTGWQAEKIALKYGFSIISEDPDYWKKDCTSTSFCPYFTGVCNCSHKTVVRRGIK
jgi:hypothetical protein